MIINWVIFLVFQFTATVTAVVTGVLMDATCVANNISVQVEYCQKITVNIWFNCILLISAVINIIISIVFMITLYRSKLGTKVAQVESENITLQQQSKENILEIANLRRQQLTEKTSEIANLQRQLNKRNVRRGEVAVPLHSHTEQANEREPLLLEINSPDYLEPLYLSLPLHD